MYVVKWKMETSHIKESLQILLEWFIVFDSHVIMSGVQSKAIINATLDGNYIAFSISYALR